MTSDLPIEPSGVDYEALRAFQDYCYQASRARGFHQQPDRLKVEVARLRATGSTEDASFANYLEDIETGNRQMLIVGELSEGHEEIRGGHPDDETYYAAGAKHPDNGILQKPEGVPSEYADVFIRLMDECGKAGIDLAAAVKEKLEYNNTRSPLHGGKRF
jgi:hypothetical protein